MKHLVNLSRPWFWLPGALHRQKGITEEYKAQIIQTELDFVKMADEAGVAAAFYEYAADSSVIGRGGKDHQGQGSYQGLL
ncbi:MAG: hypothetical protein MZV63_31060 [Marinilabiliales bacterium]|nr:hypothetical protein [Marinilabiliales bacterium]